MKAVNIKQSYVNQNIIKIDDVAIYLGISTATVRNWVKTGNIKTISEKKYDFHFDDVKKIKKIVDKYLIDNIKFDSPSFSRYKMFEIYKQDGQYFFKLNLQVRFK